MNTNKKNKTKAIIFVILAAILLGIYFGYILFKKPFKQNKVWNVPKLNSSKKFLTKEVLIKSMKSKSELITLDISLQEKIVLDNSWGNFKLFKKVQNINFYGQGLYCVNLSKVDKNSIRINNIKKEVYLKLPKPYIKNISINENKTEYQTVEKGILRFGQIKLEPDEYNAIINEAKLKMLNEMNKPEIYNKAKKSSKDSVNKFLNNILLKQSLNNYKINLQFK